LNYITICHNWFPYNVISRLESHGNTSDQINIKGATIDLYMHMLSMYLCYEDKIRKFHQE